MVPAERRVLHESRHSAGHRSRIFNTHTSLAFAHAAQRHVLLAVTPEIVTRDSVMGAMARKSNGTDAFHEAYSE